MAVRSAYYNGPNGRTAVIVPELAYRSIVSVKREGLGYNIVDGTPGNREAQYVAADGKFIFENPFTSTVVDMGAYDLRINEKIFIIWKE
jgi:hypothetical protein